MEFRLGVTGHRPNKLPGGYEWDHPENKRIRKWMRERVKELKTTYGEGLVGCTGMALGADLFFAAVCHWEKVPFVAFCPCWGQENKWPPESQNTYVGLLKQAREIVYVHNGPYPGPQCMLERNQAMANWLKEGRDSKVLAVWNKDPKGGTADMIRRATSSGVRIAVFDPTRVQ